MCMLILDTCEIGKFFCFNKKLSQNSKDSWQNVGNYEWIFITVDLFIFLQYLFKPQNYRIICFRHVVG